jgi:serine/threonine protein kinase
MEPIPGYTLVEPLGQGGFGEVWKAEAPGGLPKAIKFVHGSLNDVEGRMPAVQELKALNRVKQVHHPFILGIERVDVVDGQLIIVMELADRNLQNRLEECQGRGWPGIPRDELLGYMQEAAEALDLMNIDYQLQHLDIKPQNLFLVRNHVKVADFGLVKDLEGMSATITSGITPVYAAPETFEGHVSRFSDQYSLAIVYQELLTGVRPFDGKNGRALLVQHVSQPPNLTPLLEGDRDIVGRALSKDPTKRFGTCSEFVETLRKSRTGATTPLPAVKPQAARRSLTPEEKEKKKEIAVAAQFRKLVSPHEKFYEDKADKAKKSGKDTVELAGAKQPTVRMEQKKADTPKPDDMPCPNCGALMIDPGPHAWCGACGYCNDLTDKAKLLQRDLSAWNAASWTRVVLGGLGVGAILALIGLLFSVASSQFLSNLPLLIGLAVAVVAMVVFGSSQARRSTAAAKPKKKGPKETGLMRRPK